MKFYSALAVFTLLAGALAAEVRDELQHSIVRVTASFQNPDYFHPWKWGTPIQKSGQGLVVGRDLVITLASTVTQANLVEVRLGAEPIAANFIPVLIDYDRNLALLRGVLPPEAKPCPVPRQSHFSLSAPLRFFWKTDRGRFLEGTAALDRADSDVQPPSFQGQLFFAGTSKSSIRGGFGEPVFAGDEFIGIATRGEEGNADFFIIPVEVIHRSVDLEKGAAAPTTAMGGFSVLPCTQPYLRKKLGVQDGRLGCLVGEVFGQGAGSQSLKTGDLILNLAGRPLDAWGRYEHPLYGTLSYVHLFSEARLDDALDTEIIRAGQRQKIKLDLSAIRDDQWLVPHYREGEPSEYFIRGGFVFQPLSMAYLQADGDGEGKASDTLLMVLEKNRYKVKDAEHRDIVVLSQALSHPVNRGLQDLGQLVVSSVDGKPLRGLGHLKQVFDNPEQDVIRLGLLPGDMPLLLSKSRLKEADPEIKTLYDILSLEYFREEK